MGTMKTIGTKQKPKWVSVLITPEIHQAIKLAAVVAHKTVGDWVGDLVRAELARIKREEKA